MAIDRTPQGRKAPSQAPKDFFAGKQSGGAHGSSSKAPEKSTSGPLMEKIYGKPELSK
jgi:hypothetical protein